MTTIAHIDGCSGVSGDMLLGALLDAGLPLPRLRSDLSCLSLPSYRLSVRRVRRTSIAARLVTVTPLRALRPQPAVSHIIRRIRRSRLAPWVIDRALASLQALYETERALHGNGLPDAFRGMELTDTLVDIVGVAAGLHRLQITQLTSSPMNLGGGVIHPAAATGHTHGDALPVPSPAAARLLTGYPVYSDGPAVELTTPTGAALIRTLSRPASLPAMRLGAIGYGAGRRDLGNWPNVVRLLVGEAATAGPTGPVLTGDDLVTIETNLDDCNPQLYDYLADRLFAQGALDVYLTPIIMKRSRPATQVSVLANPSNITDLTTILFEETPTLGIRLRPVQRWLLPRRQLRLSTPDGPVRIKLVETPGGVEARPEYRDCRAIAERTGRPLRLVIRRIEQLAAKRYRPHRRAPHPVRHRRG